MLLFAAHKDIVSRWRIISLALNSVFTVISILTIYGKRNVAWLFVQTVWFTFHRTKFKISSRNKTLYDLYSKYFSNLLIH
jgi:hypothetical protein